MSNPKYMESVDRLRKEIEALHASIDETVKARIFAVAAEISNVPTGVLKDMFVKKCASGYCRCRAIRNIAAGDDGL
jgi:hypothetical protein